MIAKTQIALATPWQQKPDRQNLADIVSAKNTAPGHSQGAEFFCGLYFYL